MRWSSIRGYYCDVDGCSLGPVWTPSELAVHKEQHHDQSGHAAEAHLQKETGTFKTTRRHSSKKLITKSDIELTAENDTCVVRRSSRIANRENTGSSFML